MVDMLPIPILILTKVLMVLPNPDMVNPPTDNPVMVPLTPILLPWVDILVTLPIPILMVEVILPTMVDTKPRPFSLSFLFLPIFCDFPVLCCSYFFFPFSDFYSIFRFRIFCLLLSCDCPIPSLFPHPFSCCIIMHLIKYSCSFRKK